MFIDSELEKSFGDFGALIGAWGEEKPDARALADSSSELTWREVAQATARIAAVLQRDGLQRGQAVAILGTSNIPYALVYLAVVRAGGCAAPLTTSATPAQLAAMFKDSGAMHLFVDAAKLADIEGVAWIQVNLQPRHAVVGLDAIIFEHDIGGISANDLPWRFCADHGEI